MTEYLTKNMYAYRALRQAILVGDYSPHERLVLKDVAERLNTSIMPVREALRQLEKDGLVAQVAHQGYTVCGLSSREIDELFELRLSLESLAIQLAAKKPSKELVVTLRALLSQMEETVRQNRETAARARLSRDDRNRFMVVNWSFHFEIAAASGYRHLPNFLNSVLDMSERYMNLLEYAVGLDMNDVEEHRKVVSMIEKGDSEGALYCLRNHLSRTREQLQEYAKNSGWAGTD